MTQRMKQELVVVLTTVLLVGSTIVWTFADQIRVQGAKQVEYRTLALSFPPSPNLL